MTTSQHPTQAAIARAIAIVEDSRRTHVEWAEWQDATPDWQSQVEPTSPGEPEHHRRCITEYDEVLAVLRGIQSNPAPPPPTHFPCHVAFCAGLQPRTEETDRIMGWPSGNGSRERQADPSENGSTPSGGPS